MLPKFPKPVTYAEGQRQLYGWLMIAAGLWSGLVAMVLTSMFVWLAFKFPDERELILYILAIALGANQAGSMMVILALALGGPVGKFKGSASREGVTLEASDDNEPVRRRDHHDGSGADNDE